MNAFLAVSSKSSKDKIDMLRAMGAKVYVCPANVSADDPRSYYQVAKRMHEEIKGSVYINQYFNELNIEAHYRSTGPEIWKQTRGKDHPFGRLQRYRRNNFGNSKIPKGTKS